MVPWVNVKDLIPEAFENILLYMPNEHPLPMVHEGYYANGTWYYLGNKLENGDVTYWAPMPNGPETIDK